MQCFNESLVEKNRCLGINSQEYNPSLTFIFKMEELTARTNESQTITPQFGIWKAAISKLG